MNGEMGKIIALLSEDNSFWGDMYVKVEFLDENEEQQGEIKDITNETIEVQNNKRIRTYKNKKMLESLGLAYCISIHKSQGSEFPIVIIPCFEEHRFMFDTALWYTAISRAKNRVIIIGSKEVFRRTLSNVKLKGGNINKKIVSNSLKKQYVEKKL